MQTMITHTCGHTETVQLYGTNSHGERARKAAWLASKSCRACERTADMRAAQAQAAALTLPELTGSEKQVAWALTIRAKALQAVATLRADFAANGARAQAQGMSSEAVAAELAQFDTLAERVAQQVSAKWWIDHRDTSARNLLALAQEEPAS